MIFEWYSGSDASGKIPQKVNDYLRDYENLSAPKRIRILEGILSAEKDPNWIGYFSYWIATEQRLSGRMQDAAEWYLRAARSYDLLGSSFRDVVDEYCHTYYYLAADRYDDEGDAGMMVESLLCALPFLEEADFDEQEQALFHSFLGRALSQLGNLREDALFHRLALVSHARAHHLDSEDPGILEGLIYSFYNLDLLPQCLVVHKMFERVCSGYKYNERVSSFIEERVLLRLSEPN